MEKIDTKFGICAVEKTGVEYQVVISFSKWDENDIEEIKKYFQKLGKYEKILIGVCHLLDALKLSHFEKIPELSNDDLFINDIIQSKEPKRQGNLDIFVRTREPDKYEKRKSGKDFIPLAPEIIVGMIQNIKNFDDLNRSIKAITDLSSVRFL